MRSILRPVALVAAAGAVGAALALAAPAHAAGSTSQVSVLHGVPGLTVDVYANGDKILSNFAPGTLTDPLSLPAGSYDLAVFPAGQPSSGTPAIKADDVEVPGGANITVAAPWPSGDLPPAWRKRARFEVPAFSGRTGSAGSSRAASSNFVAAPA